MRDTFDYGDLEKVAALVYGLMLAEAQDLCLPRPPWNKSAICLEAVQKVACEEKKP